jgi:hypothetical protein
MPQDWFAANAPTAATPPPPQDWFASNAPKSEPPQPSLMSRAANAVAEEVAAGANRGLDVLTGAWKKLAEEGVRGGALLRKIPGVNAIDRVIPPVQVNITPSNTAQKFGGALEQVAEVAVPSRMITRAGMKVAEKVAPKIAGVVGERAATMIPRAAVEAAGGAALAGAQGGSPLAGAVVSGAIPVVGSMASAVAGKLQSSAAKQVGQALGATKERYKAMAEKLTPEILKRGIRGSREQIAKNAADTAEAAGEQIDQALQEFGQRRVDTTPVVDAIEKAKDAFRVTTDVTPRIDPDAPSYFIPRTTAKPDEVWFKALQDAKKNGYKGTVGELRATFLDRVAQAKSLADEDASVTEAYGPQAILKSIRKLGGIRPFTEDYTPGAEVRKLRGDFASIVESYGAKSGYGQRGGASIFRKDGLGLDDMVDQLKQDPRWKSMIGDENDLLDVLDEIARTGPGTAGEKGIQHYLAATGVTPGATWWEGVGPKTIEIEPRALRQLDKLQSVVKSLGEDASVEHLVAIRRAWDTVVSQAGGYAHRAPGAIGVPLKDTTEAWAKREGANAIRKVLADDVPELAKLNKEYHFWTSLDDVLSQTLKRTQPHGASLTGTIKEGAGQVAGAALKGGTVGSAFALGKVAKLFNTVVTSPRWRLASAQAKDSLATAIMSGKTDSIVSALARITAVEGSKIPAMAGGR